MPSSAHHVCDGWRIQHKRGVLQRMDNPTAEDHGRRLVIEPTVSL
jgi:hypothetical protein